MQPLRDLRGGPFLASRSEGGRRVDEQSIRSATRRAQATLVPDAQQGCHMASAAGISRPRLSYHG